MQIILHPLKYITIHRSYIYCSIIILYLVKYYQNIKYILYKTYVHNTQHTHAHTHTYSSHIPQSTIYQEMLEHFMLPSADKLYGDADFIFQQDLAPAHTANGTKRWFNDHGVTVLDRAENSPDLNPIENLWSIVKRKMSEIRPNNAEDLKAAIKAAWASITPEQCHSLIASMPCRIDAVFHAKGGPTKYWVHRNEHT